MCVIKSNISFLDTTEPQIRAILKPKRLDGTMSVCFPQPILHSCDINVY